MLGQILKRFARSFLGDGSVPILNLSNIISHENYVKYCDKNQEYIEENSRFENNLVPKVPTDFTYGGYCHNCKRLVDFVVDFNYAYSVDDILMPNWRERLVCPVCGLNNRMRAVLHIFDLECRPARNSKIYITEQMTALYDLLKQSFPDICGSEYLGAKDFGAHDQRGTRNEDLTQLSFADNEFDFILSFDVFEHIPDFKRALAECFRCTKTGGALIFTVPFARNSRNNIVRAYFTQTGELVHVLPPEYHGDPINEAGCLCFRHFGWELLENLKSVGFVDVKALLYWSKDYGYLGGEQLLFVARK